MTDPAQNDQPNSPNIVARMAWGGAVVAAVVAVAARQWWLLVMLALILAGHFIIRRLWSS